MEDVKIRVIDSDKLVNAINEGSYDVNLSSVMALGAVMLDTKKLPSAQPEQRWIPCSEKLPDKDGLYLVTDDSGGVKETHESWFIECYDGTLSWDLANVTAWMPLPEPYQSEAERRTDEA